MSDFSSLKANMPADTFMDSIRDITSDAAQWKAIKMLESSIPDDKQFGELIRLAIKKETGK